MSIASDAVAVFRSFWADRFVDTVTVSRHSTGGTFNPTTLKYDGGTETTVYSGGALIRPGGNQAAEEELPNELRTFGQYSVLLPYDSAELDVEDKIAVTASVSDPQLVGKTLRVLSIRRDSYNTRREVIAELDQGRGSGRG